MLSFEFERGFVERVAIDVVLQPELRRLARSRVWSTIRTVDLGGRGAIDKLQRSSIRTLAKAPGSASRTFRPSLAEVTASIERARVLR